MDTGSYIEGFIELQHKEICGDDFNRDYLFLYKSVTNEKLRDIMASLHSDYIRLFGMMNRRLPTGAESAHFWADPSRELICIIEITIRLYEALKCSQYAFNIDKYYLEVIGKCREFLSGSGGSEIPEKMDAIILYHAKPIFIHSEIILVNNSCGLNSHSLKQIGEGSYAIVYKYKGSFYNRFFVVKRAKKDLSDKEIQRFRREYETMKELASPYILEVYRYQDDANEYVMEYMDYTLEDYIKKNNSRLPHSKRKNLVNQIFRAFRYIYSKNQLHRDISPQNILLKSYEDTDVIKISDFGLVKIPNSKLTSASTEFKGCFNDLSLMQEGFDSYNLVHETYALTRIVYFVMTGRRKIEKIEDSNLRSFVQKGINVHKSERFQNVSEMIEAFRAL